MVKAHVFDQRFANLRQIKDMPRLAATAAGEIFIALAHSLIKAPRT